jgi:hypothetical protein
MDRIMELATPECTSTAVAGLLVLSGAVHMLPGPSLAMQASTCGVPAWFVFCAGMLMLCSGLLFLAVQPWGLAAVGFCMGGAMATAAKIQAPLRRPGGCIFSSLTLAAAVWSRWPAMEPVLALAVGAAYLAGVAGRIFVPTALPKFVPQIQLLDKLCMKGAGGKKSDKSEQKKDADKGKGGKEDGQATTTTRRPRESSPAPVPKKVDAAAPAPAAARARAGA